MSRNKREGQYAGCIRGKHVRAVVDIYSSNLVYWLSDKWPNSYCAINVAHDKGILKLSHQRYVSKAVRASWEELNDTH